MKINIILSVITFIVILSCCSDEKNEPCKKDCGKLIEKLHYPDPDVIRLQYVTECKDTINIKVNLTKEQLGLDNGYSYFVNEFKVGGYYCELIY